MRMKDGAMRIVVVGFGYWGPNLARNLAETKGEPLHGVCDPDPGRLFTAHQFYPFIRAYRSFDEVLQDSEVSAVVIATPAATHYELSKRAILAGKHVLVEKPLATTVAECHELAVLARAHGVVLMVGHTFLYAPAVQHLRTLLESGKLGQLQYIYSSRLNLGIYRPDVNVLWDLAPHDLSIALHLAEERVAAVSARGFKYAGGAHEDVAFLTVELETGTSIHIHVSWLDPNKVRSMTIVGTQRMAVYDDMNSSMTIRLYDKGVDLTPANDAGSYGEYKMMVRTGDLVVPYLPPVEPLRAEVMDFLSSIQTGTPCVSGPEIATNVVAVLEAATESMNRMGERVELDPAHILPASEKIA